MTLLILLVCLALERYFNFGAQLRRFNFFPWYFETMRKWFEKTPLWQGSYQAIATILVPAFIIVAVLYHLAGYGPVGIVKFIFGAIVFVYCLGPKDLYHQVTAYLAAANKNELENAHEVAVQILGDDVSSEPTQANRALIPAIFTQSNGTLFAVVLWFAILGPAGALLYRMVVELRNFAQAPASPYANLADTAAMIQGYLEWIPARLTSFGYAVVGNFSPTLGYWLDNVFSGPQSNEELLTEAGKISIKLEPEGDVKSDEVKASLVAVDYTLLAYLGLIAVLTVISWL